MKKLLYFLFVLTLLLGLFVSCSNETKYTLEKEELPCFASIKNPADGITYFYFAKTPETPIKVAPNSAAKFDLYDNKYCKGEPCGYFSFELPENISIDTSNGLASVKFKYFSDYEKMDKPFEDSNMTLPCKFEEGSYIYDIPGADSSVEFSDNGTAYNYGFSGTCGGRSIWIFKYIRMEFEVN